MRKFNCYNCGKEFSVTNDTWVEAICPHCGKQNQLPNDNALHPIDSTTIVKSICGLIGLAAAIYGIIGLLS